ncbi:hypothetical protein [Singulisphaera sp. PoT]|uniref:hypothetical protein n=1 Tax=Singulisphaera sp. PoT TaxID=3411797 RepID=UPI003BF5B73D
MLDDRGKPLAGAKLFVSTPTSDQFAFVRGGTSRPDERFRFELARAFDKSRQDNPWAYASVVATADGFGPVWMSAATPSLPGVQPADRLTLRLARDDIAIEGRILNSEGRPVVGSKAQPSFLNSKQNYEFSHIPYDSDEPSPGTMGFVSVQNLSWWPDSIAHSRSVGVFQGYGVIASRPEDLNVGAARWMTWPASAA